MKLFEAGSLEAVKDIEENGEIAISLAEIAPEGGDRLGNVPYNSDEDPEMKSSESAPLKEKAQTRYQRHLQESKDTELLDFLKSSEDGSFEAFQNSEQYQNIQWNIQQYKDGIARLKRNGLITEEELPEGIPTKKPGQTYSRSGGDPRSSSDSIYSREGWEPKEKSSMLGNLEAKYSASNSRADSEHVFEEMENIITDIALGRSDKRHALIAGDPGIGKTYTANKIVNSHRDQCGKEIVYESGDLGAALSNVVPFFFLHSQNKLIVLDDNDRMLMKGNQGTANFMKGILDPDTKPVSIGSSILQAATRNLQDLVGKPLDESKEKVIDIDLQSLREGYFRMSVNGECVQDDFIGLQEAQELSNMIRPLRESEKKELRNHLRESDSFFDEALPETIDTAGGAASIPRTFVFNSSVIFISNLDFKDISPAVLDRCESIEVKLTLEQFMTRLEGVLKSLCKGRDYSSTPQELRDWGKSCVFTLLSAVIEAFYHNATLFSTKIEIRRKFTFRMFEEFVVYWIRWGRHWAEKRGLDIDDPNQLKKLEPELVETTLRDKIIPWISKPAD